MKHWKLALGLTAVVLLLTVGVAMAMQTATYTGMTTGTNTPTSFDFTTNRIGDIQVDATFALSNHGIYYVELLRVLPDGNFENLCNKTLDARWGRVASGEIACNVVSQPADHYRVNFQSNRRVLVTVNITAETD